MTDMKRLFKVVDHGEVRYFEKKLVAKHYRNLHKGSTLHRGPDHDKGETGCAV